MQLFGDVIQVAQHQRQAGDLVGARVSLDSSDKAGRIFQTRGQQRSGRDSARGELPNFMLAIST